MENYTQGTQKLKDSENLKLLYGLPIGICTEQEHKNGYYFARANHKIRKKQEIEQHKRELTRAREEITILKAVIKATRKEKFYPMVPYNEWIRKQREKYKGYKIIENEDSIKIK